MKLILLGDLHLGIKSNSEVMFEYYKKLYQYMFDVMKERKIDTIIQLGDLFDSRRNISFKTLDFTMNELFEPLKRHKFTMYSIVGNHDIFYRESLEVASSDLLLRQYKNVKIIKEPTTFTFGSKTFDLIPWICKENEKDVLSFIEKSTSNYCCGHFELNLWEMYRGAFSNSGIESDTLKNYKEVFSGHYHIASSGKNINYLGTPYQLSFQDVSEKKGFYIFDTEEETLEFIENPNRIFFNLYYDDSSKSIPPIKEEYRGSYLRLFVKEKSEPFLYQTFLNKLFDLNPIDLKIVNKTEQVLSEGDSSGSESDDTEFKDTLMVMRNYVDGLQIENKVKLQNFLLSLYNEAISQRE